MVQSNKENIEEIIELVGLRDAKSQKAVVCLENMGIREYMISDKETIYIYGCNTRVKRLIEN